MNRRELLKACGLGALALGSPPLLRAAGPSDRPPRLLVLVELSGGNDGLNMVVPYADARYYALRPALALAREQVLPLDEHIGLNPAMKPLMPLFAARELAVVQGVGYPQPNRSHFRSIEIWDTASGAAAVVNDGWLTHLRSPASLGRFAADAIVIGRNPAPVTGGAWQPVVMADPGGFVREAQGLTSEHPAPATPALAHLLEIQRSTVDAAQAMAAHRPRAPGQFPKNAFGRDLSQAARLLVGEPASPVVKVALSGFDTHVSQRATQDRLLGQLAHGLAALRDSLKTAGVWERTLVMTYSEFGRRAKQNASQGTDHGAAAPHLLLGGALRGGIHGPAPDLSRLDDGDVAMSTDYRRLYNTVLGRWWGKPDAMFDPQAFPPLDLV
jgi:uncharacterized protein (DUF1501 family)